MLHLHVGRDGCRMGSALWKQYIAEEPKIDPTTSLSVEDLGSSSTAASQFLPLCLFVDHTSVDKKEQPWEEVEWPPHSPLGPQNVRLLPATYGTSAARVASTSSQEMPGVFSQIDKLISKPGITGVVLTHALNDVIGSGVTSAILSHCYKTYSKLPLICFTVLPSSPDKSAPVSSSLTMNCLVGLRALSEFADASFLVDANEHPATAAGAPLPASVIQDVASIVALVTAGVRLSSVTSAFPSRMLPNLWSSLRDIPTIMFALPNMPPFLAVAYGRASTERQQITQLACSRTVTADLSSATRYVELVIFPQLVEPLTAAVCNSSISCLDALTCTDECHSAATAPPSAVDVQRRLGQLQPALVQALATVALVQPADPMKELRRSLRELAGDNMAREKAPLQRLVHELFISPVTEEYKKNSAGVVWPAPVIHKGKATGCYIIMATPRECNDDGLKALHLAKQSKLVDSAVFPCVWAACHLIHERSTSDVQLLGIFNTTGLPGLLSQHLDAAELLDWQDLDAQERQWVSECQETLAYAIMSISDLVASKDSCSDDDGSED